MPADGIIAYGRLGFGIFFQVAAVAFLGGVKVGSVEKTGGPAIKSSHVLATAWALVLPAAVFGTIGTGLVMQGLHEGNLPLQYRGARSRTASGIAPYVGVVNPVVRTAAHERRDQFKRAVPAVSDQIIFRFSRRWQVEKNKMAATPGLRTLEQTASLAGTGLTLSAWRTC